MTALSPAMQAYFDHLDADVKRAYDLAETARQKGYDPEPHVSIPLAKNMAERVEGIVSVAAPQLKNSGVSNRIIELEKEYGSQNWKIAFIVSLEVAQEKYCTFKDKREAMEVGLRIGLAYITNGVVASPLEGFVRLELKKRQDNQEYFCLFFSGPIRSAGTTATCIFVGVADYVRVNMGYAPYDPTEQEIKRTFSELEYFHERVANLQYFPSEREAEFLTSHLPVQIDGDPSEKFEVPNYKDLPRVSTNMLRNGFCLVMAEGISQKSAKFWGKFSKWNKEYDMEHWNFLEDYVKLQKEIKAHGALKKDPNVKISPDFTFIKDLVAGRPILSHPMRRGGFRLRYGRTRTSGFSSNAIHPATMFLLNNYIAIGTQLKSERPGKSTTITTCDRIEGPVIKLKNGTVIFIETIEQAKACVKDVQEIIFLGDMLVNYGDFLDRGHILAPPGYCEEWWARHLEQKCTPEERVPYTQLLKDPTRTFISCADAVTLSQKYQIPLHPRYTYHWSELTLPHLDALLHWLTPAVIKEQKIILPYKPILGEEHTGKRALELLGVPHHVIQNEYVVIEGEWADALRTNLGVTDTFIPRTIPLDQNLTPLALINQYAPIQIKDKSGLSIGARMGRPEKAKMRKMTGSPHTLFPIGKEGGRMRSLQSALEKGKVTSSFPVMYCPACTQYSVYPRCHLCDGQTEQHYYCKQCGVIAKPCEHKPVTYKETTIDITSFYDSSLKKTQSRAVVDLIKGVRGTSNKAHIPEHLLKGILRAKHRVHVNKDGTTRYDITEMAITHFKPKEIGTPVAKLVTMGYTTDINGQLLTHDDQVLELKCQDLILPACPVSIEEGCDAILYRTANFLDDLLEYLYQQPRYYNFQSKADLVGHLVIGLSPHTSAGIVCRIIGFTQTQGMHAHPLLHSIMRRDCDGDEAGVMLIMDALLNFSKHLLSDHRGATQDEPLVLTTTLIPAEVDDMVFNMDIVDNYPLAFYDACEAYKMPAEIQIETLRQHLGKPTQYEGYRYTHETDDINIGVQCSGYKTIPTMEEKVVGQMELAERIRAVDAPDVARLVIERHFLRDIKGNLRKFSTQQFRCVDCNAKFRRPPLKGICTTCNGKLLFTISEGSVIKYMQPCMGLIEKYNLPNYLKQTLELTQQRIEMVFGRAAEKQEGLGRWF